MALRIGFGLLSCQRLDGSNQPWTEIYDDALAMGVAAEAAGFDSLWVTEHHFTADGYLSGLLPLLSAIAARTSRIRLGTNVLLAPLHHPLRLAEDAAVVDLVSHGRLLLGLGIGYRDEEFDALGVPKAERIPRLVEHVATCRAAWTGGPFDFRGQRILSRPVPPGPPPIWLGSWVDAGIRRAGRLADGYISPGGGLADTVHRVGVLDAASEAAGRAGGPLPIATTNLVWLGETMPDSVRAGVAHFMRNYGEWYGSSSDDAGGRAVGDRLARQTDPTAGVLTGPVDRLVELLAPLAARFSGEREHQLVLRAAYPGVSRSELVNHIARLGDELLPALRDLGNAG